MSSWQVIEGDCIEAMRGMDEASVQCVVTSPPYWGLRDYGTATWDGGDAACDHRVYGHAPGKPTPGGRGGSMPMQEVVQREACGKCGAVRIDSQLGLEPTHEAYVERMVGVFREVRRVLRDDGTVWLNLGDSYAAGKQGRDDHGTGSSSSRLGPLHDGLPNGTPVGEPVNRPAPPGLKPKDLVGIPWRVAFALQADGWYLRSDIIWAKPNPMPESVTDRPTKSHEYVFLLSKSARYYFDADAVREPHVQANGATYQANIANWKERPNNGEGWVGDVTSKHMGADPAGRNIRSVWNIATEPFPGAHFATFPKKLVEPCVKAGSAEGDTVLDPFCGSGTTGLVSLRLGRSFIGIELNPTYAEMARHRIADDAPLFNVASESAIRIRSEGDE